MSTDDYCSASQWTCGDSKSYCGAEGDGRNCACMPDVFSNTHCTSNVDSCEDLTPCSFNSDCPSDYVCAIGCCETSHCIPLCSDYYGKNEKSYHDEVIVVIVGAVLGVIILLLLISIISFVIQHSRRNIPKTENHNDQRPILPNDSPSSSNENNPNHNNNNNNNNSNNNNNNNTNINNAHQPYHNHNNIVEINDDYVDDNVRVAIINANAANNSSNNSSGGNGNDNLYINDISVPSNNPSVEINLNDPVQASMYSAANPFYGPRVSLQAQNPQISITHSLPALMSSDNLEEYIQERNYTPVYTQPLGLSGTLQRNVSESFSKQFEGTTKVTDATVWNDIKSNPDMYCAVCMGEFTLDTKIAQLKCEHILHKNCAIEWLSTNPTCPVCRSQVNKFA